EGAITYDRFVNGNAEVRIAQDVTVSSVPFDLTFLTPAQGFVIQGDAAGDQAGRSVSSAGDVNGDGFADLIVGAFGGDGGGNNAGEAYVVFGTASGFGTADGMGRAVIDLTELAPASGFIVRGDAAYDNAGISVSAGDGNGDGFADLIVGARFGNGGGSGAGETDLIVAAPRGGGTPAGADYVVFGKASGFGTVDGTGRSVLDLT